MRYRAIRSSYGYQGRFWAKNEEVDVPAQSEQPPTEHFKPMSQEEARLSELRAKEPLLGRYLALKEQLAAFDPADAAETSMNGQDRTNYDSVLASQRRRRDQMATDCATARADLSEEQLRSIGELNSVGEK